LLRSKGKNRGPQAINIGLLRSNGNQMLAFVELHSLLLVRVLKISRLGWIEVLCLWTHLKSGLLLSENAGKLFCAGQKIFRRGQLVEDVLERLLASLFHKLGDGAVRDNRSLVNNHDPLADSLDDVENVRAVNDRFAF